LSRARSSPGGERCAQHAAPRCAARSGFASSKAACVQALWRGYAVTGARMEGEGVYARRSVVQEKAERASAGRAR